jgi:hypothetical protein
MKKILVFLMVGFLFVGCSVKIEQYNPNTETIVKNTSYKNYAIGEQKQAYVGETIIEAKDYDIAIKATDRLEAAYDFVFNPKNSIMVVLNRVYFNKGDLFIVIGTINIDGQDYKVLSTPKAQFNFIVDNNNIFYDRVLDYSRQFGLSMPIYHYDFSPEIVQLKEIVTEKTIATKSNSNYQIIYTGSDDKSFYLSYREFTVDDLAKPSFYQDLTYSKAQNNIRFRNLVIQINSVDNEKIVYMVLQD